MTAPATERASARTRRRAIAGRLALLFDQHASMVFGLCRLLLRDHHEAEDAAQQTFVSAYRSLLRGTEPRDAAPWLAAIARNECRARIRKRMRSPLALEAEIGEQFPDPRDIIDQTERRAELAALTAAIADLPSRQREAVALRDFLGLSYEEVASTLSVSVPVVESLLFRARRRLRDTVRTVPRYAAGLVGIPLALRATLSRDGDLDAATIGAAGAAGTALAAVIAKVVSAPFAAKATTAATVVAMATVGPHLGGVFGNAPAPAEAPPVAAAAEPGSSAATGPSNDNAAVPSKASAEAVAPADEGNPAAPASSAPAPSSSAPAPSSSAPVDSGDGTDTGQPPATGAPDDSEKTSPAEDSPAEPEPIREVVTTAEPPEAAPAADSESPAPVPAVPSVPLPVGPDGLPIIGLVPVDETPAANPVEPPSGGEPTVVPAPETPGPEAEQPADPVGPSESPTRPDATSTRE
jgi:RNA polymerase sigma factor (sigma-70 family)